MEELKYIRKTPGGLTAANGRHQKVKPVTIADITTGKIRVFQWHPMRGLELVNPTENKA